MEKISERDRSSRKSSHDHDRYRDRDSGISHRNRDRDRDRDQKQRHHDRHHRSSKNSDEKRHGDDDDRRQGSRELTHSDAEEERDRRRERSSSRARNSADCELTEEPRHHYSNKRRERGDEEAVEKNGKRIKVSEGERDGRKERRRFEDRASDGLNGDHKEEKCDDKSSWSRRKEQKYKIRDEERENERVKDDILSDGDDKKKSRKEGRKFTDTMKVQKMEVNHGDGLHHQKEVKDEHKSKDRLKEGNLDSALEEKYDELAQRNSGASDDVVESESSVGNINLWLEATDRSKSGRIVGVDSLNRTYKVFGTSSSASLVVRAEIKQLTKEISHLKELLAQKDNELEDVRIVQRQRDQEVKDLNEQMNEFRRQQMFIMQHLQLTSSSSQLPPSRSPPANACNNDDEDVFFDDSGDDSGYV